MQKIHQVVYDVFFCSFGSSLHDSGGLSFDCEICKCFYFSSLEVIIQIFGKLETLVEYSDSSLTPLCSIKHGKLDKCKRIFLQLLIIPNNKSYGLIRVDT